MKIAENHITTETLDHYGIVAGVCKELDLANLINEKIGSKDPRRVVQPGIAIVAMIINGLGFTNRRLYLTPQFFENKALSCLFDEKITKDNLDDHTLGKALDEIAAYGTVRFFGEIALEIALKNNLLGETVHLDSTSFSLTGQYETDEVNVIEVKHGFSKDHRPDLKQVMLSMISSGPAHLPIWIEPQNGNSSDKKTFHETLKSISSYQREMKMNKDFTYVADSAFYQLDKLKNYESVRWISRVPETLLECKNFVETKEDALEWEDFGDGYKCSEQETSCGGVKQRWILVSSHQAFEREEKTFERKLQKQEESLQKECWHQSNQLFNCEKDAMMTVKKLQKQYKFFHIKATLVAEQKHSKRGRPKENSQKIVAGFKLDLEIFRNEKEILIYKQRKGRFVLATNDLNVEKTSAQRILENYKQQQSVEGGFRFLKDPWFMVDSFFLKKRSRIAALMVVMALCLLVYNFAQHKMRTSLKEFEETLPDQKGKPTQKPTMKWIFQLMEGVHIIQIIDKTTSSIQRILTNLNDVRRKIVTLMGPVISKIYGI